jgi:hypothetical protein
MVLERFNGKIQPEGSELYINDIKSKGSIIKEKELQTEGIKLCVSTLMYNNFC